MTPTFNEWLNEQTEPVIRHDRRPPSGWTIVEEDGVWKILPPTEAKLTEDKP